MEAEGQQKKRQEDWGWGIGREQDRRMGKTEVDMAGKPWADRQSDRNGGGAEGLTQREGDGWEPEGGETRLGT